MIISRNSSAFLNCYHFAYESGLPDSLSVAWERTKDFLDTAAMPVRGNSDESIFPLDSGSISCIRTGRQRAE